jgi:hypothetical protein
MFRVSALSAFCSRETHWSGVSSVLLEMLDRVLPVVLEVVVVLLMAYSPSMTLYATSRRAIAALVGASRTMTVSLRC